MARAFSAGFDLDMGEDDSDDAVGFLRSELRKDFDIIMRFWGQPKPTSLPSTNTAWEARWRWRLRAISPSPQKDVASVRPKSDSEMASSP